ncbi:MAG TPA: formate dehydrogenase accessory sulfurtransferase FdhD [Rhodanobacteraceae bacterium]|nr:formate dehydrogenase accessory sulfurtransferase FdhD [Rhodanobacteraceae bacterium]
MSSSPPQPGLSVARTQRVRDARRIETFDQVIEETPVALLYNGVPYAVMMATPCDLDDFALGFALSEGIIERAEEFEPIDCLRNEHGISLQGLIPQVRFEALETRKRNLSGRSGCGLCGVESLTEAVRPVARVQSNARFETAAIERGLQLLAQLQPLNERSGGVHAAGYAHANGILVREDVGRHNALDKLIGGLARGANADASAAWRAQTGFLAITSRASYEIVHKAAAAGIAVVAAISAPTSLAIRLAEEAGITLIAFARANAMNVYTYPQRLV